MVSRASIGVYLITVAVLVLNHLKYVRKDGTTEMIMETFRNVMAANRSPQLIKNCGGGMLGAILAFLFNWAFSIEGIVIVKEKNPINEILEKSNDIMKNNLKDLIKYSLNRNVRNRISAKNLSGQDIDRKILREGEIDLNLAMALGMGMPGGIMG